MNSTTWQELLNRILKIETNNTDKEQGVIRNFKNSITAINPDEDQVIVTRVLQKVDIPFPKDVEIEAPNVQNMKFDELTLGAHTPTTSRKKVTSSQSIDLDSGHSTMRRSYNRLSEPIPPRSSLRQKKLEDFYSMAGSVSNARQRSVSVGGRSIIGDLLGQYGAVEHDDEDGTDSFGTGSYMYVDRSLYSETGSNRMYEDPYFSRDKDLPSQLVVQSAHSPSLSIAHSPSLTIANSPSRSPALPPRNLAHRPGTLTAPTPPRYPHRNRARNRSPTKLYEKIVLRNNSPQRSPLGSPAQPVHRRLDFSDPTEKKEILVLPKVQKPAKPPPVYERKEDYLKPCRTLFPFRSEFEGCLSVQKSERLLVHKQLSDGWSLVENEQKLKGFVPTDYLEFEI